MTLEEIKELVLLMEQTDLTELKVQAEDFKLTLRKGTAAQAPAPLVTPAAESRPLAAQPRLEKAFDQDLVSINSPMVGTFYHASSPDSEPFVKVGDPVSQGQTMCIVEAMKLMNDIKSEYDGTIVAIAVENGQAVEYNQVLFWIKRS
ncbi:MAG: acetyl-CoA carboxylase biotin carboxyl carrier protein [Syntrophomonas sp.]|nr:acetyl-CoA carboxylase biotin carboxyl carrier protein [Syntrophomonas sp.]